MKLENGTNEVIDEDYVSNVIIIYIDELEQLDQAADL